MELYKCVVVVCFTKIKNFCELFEHMIKFILTCVF